MNIFINQFIDFIFKTGKKLNLFIICSLSVRNIKRTIGFLTLQALVPNYAIKKGSLLLKERENLFATTNQCQHAQRLYDRLSCAVNSYPYGIITCYDFEPWTNKEFRLYVILKYDKGFEEDNIL